MKNLAKALSPTAKSPSSVLSPAMGAPSPALSRRNLEGIGAHEEDEPSVPENLDPFLGVTDWEEQDDVGGGGNLNKVRGPFPAGRSTAA